jgi:hypothetical protein
MEAVIEVRREPEHFMENKREGCIAFACTWNYCVLAERNLMPPETQQIKSEDFFLPD